MSIITQAYEPALLPQSGIEPSSVDLIVAAAPYGLDFQHRPYEDYLAFVANALKGFFGWTASTGRLCLQLPFEDRAQHRAIAIDTTRIAKEMGWKYHSTIVLAPRRNCDDHARAEALVVFCKDAWKRCGPKRESDISRDDFLNWTNGFWVLQSMADGTAFYEEVAHRCVKLFSFKGDAVLEPFPDGPPTDRDDRRNIRLAADWRAWDSGGAELPGRARISVVASPAPAPGLAPALPFFQRGPISIYHADILKAALPGELFDLVVTSPPYNIDIAYNSHQDGMGYAQYQEFSLDWMRRCRELTRPGGFFCLNIPLDKNKGGQQSIYSDLASLALKAGWKYHSTIIWNEQNISRRTAWGSWLSASAPFVIAPVEMIVVFSNGATDERAESPHPNAFWTFNGESKKRIGHPAPFPLELPVRCINLFSPTGGRILDPFGGSGTSLVACLQSGRHGTAVELDADYCGLAQKRLEGTFDQASIRSLALG